MSKSFQSLKGLILTFDEADDWFSAQYGDDWMQKDWDCILWDGSKIAR